MQDTGGFAAEATFHVRRGRTWRCRFEEWGEASLKHQKRRRLRAVGWA